MIFIILITAIIIVFMWPKKTYINCEQMKRASDTSYNAALDRDHDGKSCE